MSKTVSKVAGFVIGAVLIGIGIATGNVGLIVQGGAMIVTQAIVDLTAAKVPARQASEQSIQLGETPRVLQIGETFTAGSLVDGFNYGGKYGTDWECLVIRLADHPCEGLSGFYVNDEYNPYTGNGLVARYDDQLEIYFRSDTTNQALPSRVTDHGPGWTAADIGESGCDVVVCYKADKPDDKHPGWPGGRPRFGFVIKGALCYDPRLDDTVAGGSGPHREDDPATWEWSENPVICRYKWVRGVYANDDVSDQSKLLVGRGLTADEAPPENIIAAANLCDELVAAGNPWSFAAAPNTFVSPQYANNGSTLYSLHGTSFQAWDIPTRSLLRTATLPGSGVHWPWAITPSGIYATAVGSGHMAFVSFSGSMTDLGTIALGFEGVAYAGGQVLLYPSSFAGMNVGVWSGSFAEFPTNHFPTHFFTNAEGAAIAVGTTSGNVLAIGPALEDAHLIDTTAYGTSGDAFGFDNGQGKYVVRQGNHLFLIDKATLTITSATSAFAWSTLLYESFTATRPGAATFWNGPRQYNSADLSLIRTIDPSDWPVTTPGGYTQNTSELYDPINNALLSFTIGSGGIIWRFLDRHGGYRVAGPIYSNQDFIDVEGMFAAATAGNIITHEGSVELEPGQAKSIVATITDDDLLVGSQTAWNQGFLSESNAEWVNGVVGRYVEPDLQWQDHATPIARDTADIIADGRPREASITMRLVRHLVQAQRVVEINRRLGRLWGRASVKLGPRFCELEEGDWISWQSDRFGFTKTFRIEAYSIDEKWQIALTLREIAAGVYADDADFPVDGSQPGTTPPPPDVGTPETGNWALAAVTLDSPGASLPALEITGDASDDDYVTSIIFEYWRDDGVIDPVADPDSVPWISAGRYSPDTTKVDVTSIIGGATYYAAVSYVVDGEAGDRLVLGPVTVSDYSSGFIALENDTTPLQLEDGLTPFNLG